MKKRLLAIIGLVVLLNLTLLANRRFSGPFLGTAIAVDATVTKVHGSDFTSNPIRIAYLNWPDNAAFVVEFTRATGSASTINIEVEASFDGGTTWAILRNTAGASLFQVPTNTTAQTGNIVRVLFEVGCYGISHLRLRSVYNSDAANNITAFNLYLSI